MTIAAIPRLPRAGDTIDGSFVLGEEIGRGSMGVVYEATEIALQRRVALKMMLPRALGLEGVVERFMRGAQLAGALQHANAVQIYNIGLYQPAEDASGLPYMAMEHLQGEDLYEFMAARGRVSLGETVELLSQALEVIGEAHTQGIIHRDLKPENLFLCEDGVVKVLDFGLAKAVTEGWGQLSQRLTATGMTCGTPEYMAPEQAVGEEKVGPALDVYALGCILYHMLVGRPPFVGKGALAVALKHVQESPPPLPAEWEDHPVSLVIERCLAKLPSARFADAIALREALVMAADGEDPSRHMYWPSEKSLLSPYQSEPLEGATDPMVSSIFDGGGLSPQTLDMMPVLADVQEGRSGWMGDTIQADPMMSGAIRSVQRGGMAPGAVSIDLEAANKVVDYSRDSGAQTVIAKERARPRRKRPPEPTQPISTISAPAKKRAPTKPPEQGRGVLWLMVGLGVLILLAATALGTSLLLGGSEEEVGPASGAKSVVVVQITQKIVSQPDGAKVVENGQVIGSTPFTITREKDSPATQIYLSRDGFEDHLLNLTFDQNRELHVALKPLPSDWLEDSNSP